VQLLGSSVASGPTRLAAGDGLALCDVDRVELEAEAASQLLLLDLA